MMISAFVRMHGSCHIIAHRYTGSTRKTHWKGAKVSSSSYSNSSNNGSPTDTQWYSINIIDAISRHYDLNVQATEAR